VDSGVNWKHLHNLSIQSPQQHSEEVNDMKVKIAGWYLFLVPLVTENIVIFVICDFLKKNAFSLVVIISVIYRPLNRSV
jgi:hypothetical protein